MKKALSVLLAICLVVCMVPLSASAASSGTCGDNVTWTYSGKTLTISGTGDMYDYTGDMYPPWPEEFYDYEENIKVVVESGVTSIGDDAFHGCYGVTSVSLPNGLTRIGDGAFFDCDGITELDIPESVRYLGDGALSFLSFTSVNIPEGVTELNGTFNCCFNLKSVVIPEGVTKIGTATFQSCDSLESVVFPSTLKEIGYYAFSGAAYGTNGPLTMTFKGDAPTLVPHFSFMCENGVIAYYPENNSTWTSDIFEQSYGCETVWIPYDPEEDDTPTSSVKFTDVPADAYYAGALNWAVIAGVTSGTSATTFSPNASCTRAQAVTFLWRAAGSPKVEGATGFSDVADSAYYADAVKWAVANGITQGTGGGKFSPNSTCNRAQIVTFIWRAYDSPEVSGRSAFFDVADNAYYADAVDWAVEYGITMGTGGDRFGSNDNCTRAQIVTFLYRAYM